MAKALVLFSGGLDSTIAVALLKDQNIEVEGIHFYSAFTTRGIPREETLPVKEYARLLGLNLIVENNTEDFLRLIKNPKHGYGKNINPCIDCRIRNINRAAQVMREIGADYLVTGEVLGERPMSQNRGSLRLIIKETGLEGLLLRPLSAKLLAPTIPEEKGWVDREQLMSISGRSRKPQLALAKRFGIDKFPSPAGGCLVTDAGFSHRMRELLADDPDCDVNDVNLLKFGRHFRLGPKVKFAVGRHEEENSALETLAREGDLLLEVVTHPGPVSLVRGPASDEQLGLAASATIRYSKAIAVEHAAVRFWRPGERDIDARILEAAPADENALDRLRIAVAESVANSRRGRA